MPQLPPPPELVLREGVAALRPHAPEFAARAEALRLRPRGLELLASRREGVLDAPRAEHWLDPRLAHLRKPTEMAGFGEAIELLSHAIDRGWRIGIFGDYDVDGVTTTTILSTFLESLGAEVCCRVADRDAGYGFTVEAARSFAEAGCRLVLTGDCGTSDHEALAELAGREIPVVIIDHHQVPEQMPEARALLNPHQSGCEFPFKGLCSAGVAFYLCAALRTARAKAGQQQLPDPRAWLDLVALGTVCDMVPLVDENRILTRHGLDLLSQRRRPGIRALLERARVPGDVPLDEGHLGFTLGPRLNAPGRFASAEPALALLRARSDAEAKALAAEVEMFNQRRRDAQTRVEQEALALLAADPKSEQRHGIVVAHDNWVAGVVGIAANGIVDRYRRPTLVVSIDRDRGEARGSARSHGEIDVHAALEACRPLLRRAGGHKAAAGVSLDVEKVPELVEAFDAAVEAQVRAGVALGEQGRAHDGELPFVDLDRDFMNMLEPLRPFGVGFEAPVYLCSEAKVVSTRVFAQKHLGLSLAQSGRTYEATFFGGAAYEVARGDSVGALFTPQLRSFRGRTQVELRLERLWSQS